MSKQSNPRRVADNEARAVLKNIKGSTQKLNLVASSIRGLHVSAALDQLTFMKKPVARDIRKLLSSAIANAENNHNLDVDNLYVAEAYTGKSMVIRRFRARARGRVGRILKPFSQMTIVVRERAEAE